MELTLSLVLRGIDRASNIVRQVTQSVKELNRIGDNRDSLGRFQKQLTVTGEIAKAAGRLGPAFSNAASAAGALGLKLGAIGFGAGWLIKSQFLDLTAQFEQFEAVLGTIEGSSDKAKKSFDWIRDFAKKTPYEVIELTEAFVRLRSYGLDPTDGTMATLGDTAAAMGKDLMMAVEAIADATTGEFERLKEFGIKGAQKGNLARFEYTDRDGNQQHKVVDRTNRKIVQSTLMAIWNEKYAGAMETQAKTWKGMVSNLEDMWTDFRVGIMKAGVFDFLKTRLQGLLDTIEQMKASGELDAWVKRISTSVVEGLTAIWESRDKIKLFVVDVIGALKLMLDAVGGVKNALIILGVLMSASTVNAAVTLATTIGSLLVPVLLVLGETLVGIGVMLLATPVGWFILAIAAIAGIAFLVRKNWEPIKGFFIGLWNGIKSAFSSAVTWVREHFEAMKLIVATAFMATPLGLFMTAIRGVARLARLVVDNWEPIKQFFVDLWDGAKTAFMSAFDWISERITTLKQTVTEFLSLPGRVVNAAQAMLGGSDAGVTAGPRAPAIQRLPYRVASLAPQEVTGRIGISFDGDGRPRVNRLEARGGIALDVSTGLSMVSP